MRIPRVLLTIFTLSFLTINVAFGQNLKKMLSSGNELFDAHAFEQAIPYFRDVLLLDNSFEAKMKLAHCYRLTNNYEKAEYWYSQLIATVPNEPLYKLYYAQMLQSNGKTDEAKHWYLEYGKYDVMGDRLAAGVDKFSKTSKFNNEYEVVLLPFNSPESDFSPVVLGNGLLFCSDRRNDFFSKTDERTFSDMYYTEKLLGNAYSTPLPLKGKVNTIFNDGPASIARGDTMMFFSRNAIYKGKKRRSAEGTIKLNLFKAEKINGKWVITEDFQHNSAEYSITHPSLSPDGQNLYFTSDMSGGFGGTDIYVCTRIDSFWSSPVNLGATVNTPGNERYPAMDRTGNLYFASNGHPGFGGLDIFKTSRKSGRWVTPENMGNPFNSAKDDFGITFYGPKSGYFSSNREDGFGKDDIYHFQSKYEKPANSQINATEVVSVQQPGLSNSIINEFLGIDKVYFVPGDWNILPETAEELDKVAAFMHQNLEVKIEVSAHTDSRGDDFINFEISSRRAEVIRDYLVEKGVKFNRLHARGYGELQLLNHCNNGMKCSDRQHNINNRVEFRVLEISGIGDDKPVKEDKGPKFFRPGKGNKIKPPSKPVLQPNEMSEPNDYTKLNYRVYIGPFKDVDNDTYYTYAELNTQMDLKYDLKKGMMIVLGPYNTIREAETYQQHAIDRGAKKTNILVFDGETPTEFDTRKLKKLGVE